MDRRQARTHTAIIDAFTSLLAEKSYAKITVQDIIDRANVGRTTFYAHFETKDSLLGELCDELFGHIVAAARDHTHTHGGPGAGAAESVFCHLLHHLQENDHDVLGLLSGESADLFMGYFKQSLDGLVREQLAGWPRRNPDLPEDFVVDHVSGSFVEMVQWWIRGGMRQTPEELDAWFRAVLEHGV